MDTPAVDAADLHRRARRSLNELILDIIAARHLQRGGDVLITGVDIIEIDRVKRVYELYGERFPPSYLHEP